MRVNECHRRLCAAGIGFELSPRGWMRYTGGPIPDGLRGFEGEFATWLRLPFSYRKRLGDANRHRRGDVGAEYDRLLCSHLAFDETLPNRPRVGADLAMRAAFREVGG